MLNSTIFIFIKLFLHLGRKASDEIENKKKNLKNLVKIMAITNKDVKVSINLN
jgi:hypothetical protein